MAYEIVNRLIPTTLYALKSPYTMIPEFVTIHNTYNDATAANEVAYMTRNTTVTSYHVAIDDKQAIHAIPFGRSAWHAGDGQGAGNRKSIGIEICYSKSGGQRYVEAEANAIEYVAQLLKQRGWTVANVKWHRDWSGKNCPHRIFAEGRADAVRKAIADRLMQLNKPVQVAYDAPKTEGGVRMFKPSSATLAQGFTQFLADTVKDGHVSQKWADDYKAGKLTLDDALALKVFIDDARRK